MKTTILAGVVALVAIVVAGAVILSHDLTPSARMIVVQGMFTGVFTLITGLLAAAKADRAVAKTDAMHHDLQNGLIPEKVQEAITEMAADPSNGTVTITPTATVDPTS